MPNPNMMDQLRQAGMNNPTIVPIPSQAQRDEVVMVRNMQVRTQAADMATKLLAGKAPQMRQWRTVAETIERYIQGEPAIGDARTPLLPGS